MSNYTGHWKSTSPCSPHHEPRTQDELLPLWRGIRFSCSKKQSVVFWFWCLDAYPIFLRKLHLLFCGSQRRGVETITFSSTQRDCFPLSYQNNLCSLFTVHKKYLTLLYHYLSPENIYKSFKIFSFINLCTSDTHIKWAQVYLVTTTLMLQSLTPYRWHQRSGSCHWVTTQQGQQCWCSWPCWWVLAPFWDAQCSQNIPLLPLSMIGQTDGWPGGL